MENCVTLFVLLRYLESGAELKIWNLGRIKGTKADAEEVFFSVEQIVITCRNRTCVWP